MLSPYLEMVKQQRPAALETFAVMLDRLGLPEEQGVTLKPGMLYHTLLKVVKPVYEQVPPEQWATVPLHGGLANLLHRGAASSPASPSSADFARHASPAGEDDRCGGDDRLGQRVGALRLRSGHAGASPERRIGSN